MYDNKETLLSNSLMELFLSPSVPLEALWETLIYREFLSSLLWYMTFDQRKPSQTIFFSIQAT